MLLKKKIQASSLAEAVIAVSIIALCIGIASLVFIRSTRVTINFQDVKKQTEIQSELWEKLYKQEIEVKGPDETILEVLDTENDSIETMRFKGSDDKVLWDQDWLKE
ncbi:MAG: hypothetical protein MK066_09070 [Crocinitomicaceae bacterium]|nr:hypothetical protein [Crocinitomicaceae bacterium]